MTKSSLPLGIVYRHNLYFIIYISMISELIVFVSTASLWNFGIGGKVILSTLCLTVLIFWLRHFFWLEKNGWWVYRPIEAPALPLKLAGTGWKVTFESQGMSAHSSLWRGVRVLDYAKLKFVDAAAKGRGAREVFFVEHGKTPLVLMLNDGELMTVLTLLAHYAPQVQFRGSLAPMSQGWRPRGLAEWN